jgi:RNA polymerase sigma-70 factor (ECF subfamily)
VKFVGRRIAMDHKEMITDLMNRYGTQILHLSYSYVRDRQTAEDLTQEIFVKCYEKLHTFNGNSSIETWLYRIAVNHCKDYLKSWQFRKVTATGYISSLFTSNEAPAEQEYIKREEQSGIRDAVFRLPIKYREIIFLYYFKEYSQKEISEICHVNLNTVKARMARGKELIKKYLSERGVWDGERFEKDKKSNA